MRQKKCHEQGKYKVLHPREEQSRHQDLLISHQIQSRSALHILGFLIEFALSTESVSNRLSLLRVSFHQPFLNSFALYTQPCFCFVFFSLTLLFLLSFILPWELLLSGFSGPSFPASLELSGLAAETDQRCAGRETTAPSRTAPHDVALSPAPGLRQHSFPHTYPIACKKLSDIS